MLCSEVWNNSGVFQAMTVRKPLETWGISGKMGYFKQNPISVGYFKQNFKSESFDEIHVRRTGMDLFSSQPHSAEIRRQQIETENVNEDQQKA